MNKLARTFLAITLITATLPGCSTVNGQPVTDGRAVAGAILGILVVGGLIALAANQDDEPDSTIVTRGPNGTYVTEVYR